MLQVDLFAQVDSTRINGNEIEYITKDANIKIQTSNVSIGSTIRTKKVPSTAALYSAALPGLGQLYNGRYWKAPIVWVSMGVGVYATIWNQKNYNVFLEAYRIRLSGGVDDYFVVLKDEEQLISWMDFYRNQRDLSVIITIGLYALNIIDAYVDAHLLNFEISDDLSMRVEPSVFPDAVTHNNTYGLRLSLNL